jgi:molecular chaperone HtpG
MSIRSGKVSVTTENIFPIIRKWLYTDHDIFVRELVSNAADAIAKYKRLIDWGETSAEQEESYAVNVTIDEEQGTLSFSDNGIGMTADEIDRYINQIAFSGAMDFVEKYKESSTDKSGIIGHFGLGFYSAFMVADKVRIETKSYIADEPAVSWESEDGMEYTISPCDKQQRGSVITLWLSEEAKGMFDAIRIRSTLKKYCSFLGYDLYFTDVKQEAEDADRREKEIAEKEAKGETYEYEPVSKEPLNNKTPLWAKSPKECTDEEYKAFYHEVFQDMRDPLFWIHLNMDYPFTLQGILYFPKTNNVYESLDGRIKIYNHQVFVADNLAEVIPEFLFLLRGCLDCSDLPLNVSRSALQQDEYVKKLSGHIVRKVSDKLNDEMKKDRESFSAYWNDISVFVKYGMMKDEKFYEKTGEICLFKTIDGSFHTLKELTAEKDTVRYTQSPDKQAAYVEICTQKGYQVVVLDEDLDNNFISFLEYKYPKIHFKRVDAEFEGEVAPEEDKKILEDLFRRATQDDLLDISLVSIGDKQLPAFIRETEEARRMREMRKQFEKMRSGNDDDPYKDLDSMFPEKRDLVLNNDHPLILRLRGLSGVADDSTKLLRIAQHVYDQALLSHGTLDAEGLKRFLKFNSELLTDASSQIS